MVLRVFFLILNQKFLSLTLISNVCLFSDISLIQGTRLYKVILFHNVESLDNYNLQV